ncbi:MAG: class I SAM-dependent methyltransferase [Lachnospiraceae bacterium]|nr:class I SAM-dependent methyltransferase [Lachnospiraceae bacterium]
MYITSDGIFRMEEKLVIIAKDEFINEAKEIAKHLNIELKESAMDKELYLKLDEKGLSLNYEELEMYGDLTSMARRLKKDNLSHEFIVKASKIKGANNPITILDATAGMGEDSLLLAAAGFEVDLYEYNPVIAALLRDSLKRAAAEPSMADIVSRMVLHEEDSIKAMEKLEYSPDVVVLDPMFPERQKSASVKKKFQLLQKLECPCATEEELFNAAKKCNPRKIVIKRPLKGAFLDGKKPDYSLEGKAIRYDVFVFSYKAD